MKRLRIDPLLVISVLIAGGLTMIGELNKKDMDSVDLNVPNPNPKVWPTQSIQQRANNCTVRKNSQITYDELKEVKVYKDGRWITIDVVRVPKKDKDFIDWDMVWDETEGK